MLPIARTWAVLDVECESQPISGRVSPPGGPPLEFRGWIQLTAVIEALRTGGIGDRDAAPPPAPEASPG